MSRHPSEILAVIDQAQERLGSDFDLRALVWEVINDLIDSAQLAASNACHDAADEVANAVHDYAANHYGDD